MPRTGRRVRLLVLAGLPAAAGLVLAGCLTGLFGGGRTVLTEADHRMIGAAVQDALETGASGEIRAWHNPETELYGTVIPLRTYRTAGGLYCRAYEVGVIDPAGRRTANHTACRDSDGVWKAAP